jgi:hypothetical protein
MNPLINKVANVYLHFKSENIEDEEYVSLEDVINVGGPLDYDDQEMDLADFDLWLHVNDTWVKVKDFVID